jgi:hypothetical protein
MECV